ncbi:MAG: tRNA (adenosine(37)-N6)-threonylcarbamoyltransferase complex ATPase subunit type 1 TsaE [Spirochaetota bacterium]
MTVLLTGEMGAGKTTFTSHLVTALGSKEVHSPTFTLINKYRISQGSVFHFDLYRLKEEEELEELGFEDIWGVQGLSIIEWWQIARNYLPPGCMEVSLEILDEERRKITVYEG